jgi:translation initiation factor IF-2
VAAAPTPTKSVTEKRVGATVIRRRAKVADVVSAPVEETPSEELQESQEEEPILSTTPVEEQSEETAAEELTEQSSPETESVETSAPGKGPIETVKKTRKLFPSIIKKVGTEQYLGEKIGPKSDKPKVEKPKTDLKAKGKTETTPSTTGTGAATGIQSLKRVQEIDLTTSEAAKEAAGKKKTTQKQDSTFRSTDYLKRELIHATKKRKNVVNRPAMKTMITTPAEHKRVVEMGDSIKVADLAKQMGVKSSAVLSKLTQMGSTVTVNDAIDHDTASLVAGEFKYEVTQKIFREEDYVVQLDLTAENLKTRPPVVTIMGHVDHGKTSLLDAIRKTQVAAGEAGGITQHIGAYTVQLPTGKITFIDTPGHEAFTAMRARGAKVTDIVIIVVSAIDGVMPQTLESIAHAKAAGVPIIVAVNKIDLPDANPDKIKQVLAGHELNPEEWGGDTIYVSVSARTGKNVDKLLESILLQADMLELKANYAAPVRGRVVESKLDKARGTVATILIQHGQLKAGKLVVCGKAFGKVRAMVDSYGKRMEIANPGDPVEVLGLPEVLAVGDEFFEVADEKTARDLTSARVDQQKLAQGPAKPRASLEDLLAAEGTDKELRVILKADVQGSTEALREALSKLPTDKVKLRILHVSTGGVNESDVMLALASRAVILGFNIRPDVKALKIAEAEGVEVRTYSIIYDLLEDTKKLLEGLLDKIVKEKVIGRAEVREVFVVPKIGTIAGSAVIDGKVTRGCYLRLLRDSRVVYEGKISSLKRFKEDVREVNSGYECGIGVENFNDIKLGDHLEAFIREESKGIL